MRSIRSLNPIGCGVALLALVCAADARACINQGNLEPCHCIENMLMAVTRAAEPVVSPTLTGKVGPTDAQTQGVEVGSNYYHTDINPGDGAGDATGNVTIYAGDTVHWADQQGGHTVTAVPNSLEQFDSGFMSVGDSFDYTFNTPGTYQYYCQLHSFVTADGNAGGPQVGVVTVLPVPEPVAAAVVASGALLLSLRRRRA